MFEEFIPTLIQLCITFILLLYEQWILGLLFAISMPITMLIPIYAAKRVQPYRRRYHQKYDDAVGELGESLLNISTVKDYVQEERQYQKFNHLLSDYIDNTGKNCWEPNQLILPSTDIVCNTDHNTINNLHSSKPLLLQLNTHGWEDDITLGLNKIDLDVSNSIDDIRTFVANNNLETPFLFLDNGACGLTLLDIENYNGKGYCCWPQNYVDMGVWVYFGVDEGAGGDLEKDYNFN